MFSEYASRFLAQSQSRISFRQPEEPKRNPLERPRRRDQTPSRLINGRSYLQRPGAGNPYLGAAASHLSQFPFASRSSATPAPLFYSATDEFREEDDVEEHEREVADFYALQRSRRQFVGTQLDESSEVDDDGSRASGIEGSGDGRDADERDFRGGGIKSSWTGERANSRMLGTIITVPEEADENHLERVSSKGSSTGRGKLYDVGLDSTMRSGIDLGDRDEPPTDLVIEMPPDDNPPSIQQFRKPPKTRNPFSQLLLHETENEAQQHRPLPPDSDSSSLPPIVAVAPAEPPRHDAFWGNLYLISLIALFASFLLVFLHTSAPSLKHPLGDTVYTTLHASFYLLAVDTLIAIIVAFCWLALLRSYIRPLVYAILITVPIILLSFSLYPLVSSFSGPAHGTTVQDRAMRWLSPVPGFVAIFWIYIVYTGRRSFGKAVGILEFSCRILAANPALLLLGFGALAGVVAWTWLWMGMFTRVFLGGHLSTAAAGVFIVDLSTWWLGAFFVLVYLWTLAIGSGLQRAATAATVSQWYFHRLAVPVPTSQQVVRAALSHATTTLFGTVALSTLLTLLIRLPILLLPRRLVALIGLCTYTFLPNSTTTLTHPITLTYSAIHSQPLTVSARAVSQLSFVGAAGGNRNPACRASTLEHAPFTQSAGLAPYKIALLLLHSTRLIASCGFGFGAWVSTARSLALVGASASTIRGSLYAYVVGLIAGAIGWGVLGAMEGVLTGVVDAAVVCWASEVRNGGEVRYCREAGDLFGGEEGRFGGGEERFGGVGVKGSVRGREGRDVELELERERERERDQEREGLLG